MNKIIENLIFHLAVDNNGKKLKVKIKKAKQKALKLEDPKEVLQQIELLEYFTFNCISDLDSVSKTLKNNMGVAAWHLYYNQLVDGGWINVDKDLIVKSINKIVEENWLPLVSKEHLDSIERNMEKYYPEMHGRAEAEMERLSLMTDYEKRNDNLLEDIMGETHIFLEVETLGREFALKLLDVIKSDFTISNIYNENILFNIEKSGDDCVNIRISTVDNSGNYYGPRMSFKEFCVPVQNIVPKITRYLDGKHVTKTYNKIRSFMEEGIVNPRVFNNYVNEEEFALKFEDKIKKLNLKHFESYYSDSYDGSILESLTETIKEN